MTGGARGIGRAIAVELLGRGYQVVVTDIDEAAAKATAAEIGAPLGLGLDVRDAHATRGVVEEARLLGPLGAFVCNAGVGFDGTLQELTEDQIHTADRRESSSASCGGAAWPPTSSGSRRRTGVKGGDIGIVASLSSHGPVPGLSLYAATKAAALSLATSVSVELKKDKIRVHAVCPDGVDTQMVADMKQDGEARELVGVRNVPAAAAGGARAGRHVRHEAGLPHTAGQPRRHDARRIGRARPVHAHRAAAAPFRPPQAEETQQGLANQWARRPCRGIPAARSRRRARGTPASSGSGPTPATCARPA